MALPKPECPMGFTDAQVKKIMGARLAKFRQWMNGQTVGVCDGREYDHETEQYRETLCAGQPHGVVVYECDVQAFLKGMTPLD